MDLVNAARPDSPKHSVQPVATSVVVHHTATLSSVVCVAGAGSVAAGSDAHGLFALDTATGICARLVPTPCDLRERAALSPAAVVSCVAAVGAADMDAATAEALGLFAAPGACCGFLFMFDAHSNAVHVGALPPVLAPTLRLPTRRLLRVPYIVSALAADAARGVLYLCDVTSNAAHAVDLRWKDARGKWQVGGCACPHPPHHSAPLCMNAVVRDHTARGGHGWHEAAAGQAHGGSCPAGHGRAHAD